MRRLSLPSVALRRAALALAGTALSSSFAFATTAATPCQALGGGATSPAALALDAAMGNSGSGGPAVVIVIASDIPANSLVAGVPTPAVCEVGMVIASDGNPADSQIQVAVLLPEGADGTNSSSTWNGRFLGTGNGGFAGAIADSTLVLGLAPYYATFGKTFVVANTDMGDGSGLGNWYNCNTDFCGSTEGNELYSNQKLGGLYGNPTAIRDFGYESTHLMTVAGKALTSLFYGSSPQYSYFHGCSTGGQQALMEAQRFPNDYNGILAGSPAYNRTHLHIASAAYFEATHAPADGSGILTNPALAIAHTAMLNQCAGTDGGLATDNFLTLPASCSFSAAAVQCPTTLGPNDVPCTETASSCSCLTPNQVVSLNAAYTGALDNHGHVLFPGYERGVEDPNAGLLVEEEEVSEPLFDSLDYWAFGTSFTWQSLFKSTSTVQGELATKIAALDATAAGANTFAQVLNADNAALSTSAFVQDGGKLLMYAGYEDPLIPSASSIDYVNQAVKDQKKNGGPAVSSFLTLYMAPGMWHCNGGPGANAFGNLSAQTPPVPGATADDVLAQLMAWVENGQQPGPVIATKYVNDTPADGYAFQRPLCPYPQTAVYVNKSQSPSEPTAWACEKAPYVTSQEFYSAYGPQ
jgi:feruloyl esterase